MFCLPFKKLFRREAGQTAPRAQNTRENCRRRRRERVGHPLEMLNSLSSVDGSEPYAVDLEDLFPSENESVSSGSGSGSGSGSRSHMPEIRSVVPSGTVQFPESSVPQRPLRRWPFLGDDSDDDDEDEDEDELEDGNQAAPLPHLPPPSSRAWAREDGDATTLWSISEESEGRSIVDSATQEDWNTFLSQNEELVNAVRSGAVRYFRPTVVREPIPSMPVVIRHMDEVIRVGTVRRFRPTIVHQESIHSMHAVFGHVDDEDGYSDEDQGLDTPSGAPDPLPDPDDFLPSENNADSLPISDELASEDAVDSRTVVADDGTDARLAGEISSAPPDSALSDPELRIDHTPVLLQELRRFLTYECEAG